MRTFGRVALHAAVQMAAWLAVLAGGGLVAALGYLIGRGAL